MANMSHCRFGNTLIGMRDCISALDEEGGVQGYVTNERPSTSEMKDIKNMAEVAQELVDYLEDINWDNIKKGDRYE